MIRFKKQNDVLLERTILNLFEAFPDTSWQPFQNTS